jgi:hypothetical protein
MWERIIIIQCNNLTLHDIRTDSCIIDGVTFVEYLLGFRIITDKNNVN